MKKKNYLLFNQSGFTIVELIITVAIAAIFAALGAPSLINWTRAEKVNAYTRELNEYLRLLIFFSSIVNKVLY